VKNNQFYNDTSVQNSMKTYRNTCKYNLNVLFEWKIEKNKLSAWYPFLWQCVTGARNQAPNNIFEITIFDAKFEVTIACFGTYKPPIFRTSISVEITIIEVPIFKINSSYPKMHKFTGFLFLDMNKPTL